jgi:hypothetical protein
MVIQRSADPYQYINALLRVKEMESSVPILAPAINGNKNNLLNRIQRAMKTNQFVPKFYKGHVIGLLIVMGIVAVSATAAIRLTSEDAAMLSQFPGQNIINPPDTGVTRTVTSTVSSPDGKTKTVEVKVMTNDEPEDVVKPGTMIITMTATGEDSVIIVKADTILIEGDEEMSEAYEEALKEYQIARQEYHQKYEEIMKLQQEQYQQQMEKMQKNYQFDIQTEITDDSTGQKTMIYKIDKNMVVIPDENLQYQYFGSGDFDLVMPDGEPFREDILKEYEKSLEDYQWRESELDKYFDVQGEPMPEWTPMPPSDPELFYYYHDLKEPNLEKLMRQELYRDRLIERGQDYIIELDDKEMIINGEEQPKDIQKKYKRLYESAEETPLGPEMKYRLVL